MAATAVDSVGLSVGRRFADDLPDCQHVDDCQSSNDFLTQMSFVVVTIENWRNCQSLKRFVVTERMAAVVDPSSNFVMSHHCNRNWREHLQYLPMGMDMVAHRMANLKWLYLDRFPAWMSIAVDTRRWLFLVSQALMDRYPVLLADFPIAAVLLDILADR